MNQRCVHVHGTPLNSLILCVALIGIFQSHEVNGAERPNILFVFADDWGRYASAYGAAEPHGLNAIVKTPNFDRVVDDFVSLPDLAPTLLEAGGVTVPDVMTARSLMPVLRATGHGQIDATRDHVVIGRERHVANARTDFLPYPQRAIRTAEFLYVRNFKPDRWPMGMAPGFGLPEGPMPSAKALDASTFAAFGDMDASPTKTWLLTDGLSDPRYRRFIDIHFALRPEEELYDLRHDLDQIHNVASEPEFAPARKELSDRLLTILKDSNDPRVTGDGATFDCPPYSDPAK